MNEAVEVDESTTILTHDEMAAKRKEMPPREFHALQIVQKRLKAEARRLKYPTNNFKPKRWLFWNSSEQKTYRRRAEGETRLTKSEKKKLKKQRTAVKLQHKENTT